MVRPQVTPSHKYKPLTGLLTPQGQRRQLVGVKSMETLGTQAELLNSRATGKEKNTKASSVIRKFTACNGVLRYRRFESSAFECLDLLNPLHTVTP